MHTPVFAMMWSTTQGLYNAAKAAVWGFLGFAVQTDALAFVALVFGHHATHVAQIWRGCR
jgi:hypothetical protein